MDVMMVRFVIEQKWITEDGTLRGEVVEISDEGTSGVVEIIDGEGGRDTFRGTAEAFEGSGNWRVVT
jgi:hypothetical protein